MPNIRPDPTPQELDPQRAISLLRKAQRVGPDGASAPTLPAFRPARPSKPAPTSVPFLAICSIWLGLSAVLVTIYIVNLNLIFLEHTLPALHLPVLLTLSPRGKGIEHFTLNTLPALHLLIPGGLALLAILTGYGSRAQSRKRPMRPGTARAFFGRTLGYLCLLALILLVLLRGLLLLK
jgi:hypothetical protein